MEEEIREGHGEEREGIPATHPGFSGIIPEIQALSRTPG